VGVRAGARRAAYRRRIADHGTVRRLSTRVGLVLRRLTFLVAAALLLCACGARTVRDSAGGVRFLPASRWHTTDGEGGGCEAGGASASTGAIAEQPNDFPQATIGRLSPDATLVWACANVPKGQDGFSDAQSELDRLQVPVRAQAPAVVSSTGAGVIAPSVRGRPIVAFERGDPAAPATVVVGVIHGTEPAGLAVIRQLRTMPLPAGVHLWLVPTVNPDGLAAGTRQNAHGVDLNRNWPAGWVPNGRPWDGYYSGPRPLSEPENRAFRAFLLRVRPALTIWYHQPLDVVYGSDPHVSILRRYARLTGLPYKRLTAPRGAATRWERKR